MSTLEYTIYGIRKGWRFTRTFLFTGAFAAAIVSGVFSDAATGEFAKYLSITLFALWSLIFGAKAHHKFFSTSKGEITSTRADLELGLLLVVAVHAVVQLTGGLNSIVHPLIFLVAAFLVVYTSKWVGFSLVAMLIGIDLSSVLINGNTSQLMTILVQSVFVGLFAVLNLVFTRTEVALIRFQAKRQVEQDQTALENDARDFRLTSATRSKPIVANSKKEKERLSRCVVSEVRRTMYHHIDLLKRTMQLHSCVLLWCDRNGNELRVLECSSDSEHLTRRKIGKSEGVLGAVIQSGTPIFLKSIRPGYPGISYYDEDVAITDFLGVPVKEKNSIRGILLADRKGNNAFDDEDKGNLEAAAESILQVVSNERVFSQLQRAKSEQSKLLQVSDALSEALNEKDVLQAALKAANVVVDYDLAAITLIEKGNTQTIKFAQGKGHETLLGASVPGGTGLAASVAKTKHYLPYRGEFEPKQQIVFNKRVQRVFLKMNSLMVLPLVVGEDVLGTLTLAACRENMFNEEIRTTLQVMTNQLSTSLQNAQMVQKLEEMATTDGLTGLPNHRSFQDELSKNLAAAKRFNGETSVILCDVDKFKNVNDTYGHPVGDIVLKSLGDILRRNVVRDTDMPARYGGEEFVIVCGGTGTEGAIKLANRIRKDLEAQTYKTEKGDLRCTISMGVATYPHHARSKEDLIERSDCALYAAKQGGRNQVQVWKKGMTNH